DNTEKERYLLLEMQRCSSISSFPKWLGVQNPLMRLTSGDEQCSCALVLIAEMTSRGAPSARFASQSGLMTCQLGRYLVRVLDIIEVAKPGLQVTERGDEGRVSLTVLAISQKFREE